MFLIIEPKIIIYTILILFIIIIFIVDIFLNRKFIFVCSNCGNPTLRNFLIIYNHNATELMYCPICRKKELFSKIKKENGIEINNSLKNYNKIAIIGYSGSGKSILSKRISDSSHIPLLHIDKINFTSNWVERSVNEVKKDMLEFLENDSWIIDGTYRKYNLDTRLKEADEIVILLLPKRTCYKQVKERLKRYNGYSRDDVAEGCYENLDKTFKKWVLKDGRTKNKTARFLLIAKEYNNKTVILKSRKDINEYTQYKGIKTKQ